MSDSDIIRRTLAGAPGAWAIYNIVGDPNGDLYSSWYGDYKDVESALAGDGVPVLAAEDVARRARLELEQAGKPVAQIETMMSRLEVVGRGGGR